MTTLLERPANSRDILFQEPEAYLDYESAGALLGVTSRTISKWVNEGRVPVSRLGHRTARIKKSDLTRMVEKYSTAE